MLGPFSSSTQCRARATERNLTLCEKKKSQFARSAPRSALTDGGEAPSVRDAPSTERPRLMALRSAVASAAVSREAGRRRHRLGAFLRARVVGARRSRGRRGRSQHIASAASHSSRARRPRIELRLLSHTRAPAVLVRNLRRISSGRCLTDIDPAHRVPDAPSTECLRLMALRVVVASAVVSRKVGRGRNRLGAFSLGA